MINQNFFKENNFRKRWVVTKKLKRSERQGNSTNKKRSMEGNSSFEIAGSDSAPTLKFQSFVFVAELSALPAQFDFELFPSARIYVSFLGV